jgi:hypothetical protein
MAITDQFQARVQTNISPSAVLARQVMVNDAGWDSARVTLAYRTSGYSNEAQLANAWQIGQFYTAGLSGSWYVAGVEVRCEGAFYMVDLTLKGYVSQKEPIVRVSSAVSEYTIENAIIPGTVAGGWVTSPPTGPLVAPRLNYIEPVVTVEISEPKVGFYQTAQVGLQTYPSSPVGTPAIRASLFTQANATTYFFPNEWVLMGVDHDPIVGTNLNWTVSRYQYRYPFSI